MGLELGAALEFPAVAAGFLAALQPLTGFGETRLSLPDPGWTVAPPAGSGQVPGTVFPPTLT